MNPVQIKSETLRKARLVGILEHRRFWIFLRLLFNGVLQAGAALAASRLMNIAFDRALHQAKGGGRSLVTIGAGLTVAALVIAWLRMVERIDAEKMGQDYANQLRIRLFEHISSTSVRSLQRRSRGGVMLRFIGDLKVLRQWISTGLSRLIVAAATTTVAMIGLAQMNLPMALSASAIIAVGCAMGFAWGAHLHNAVKEARRQQSIFAANVNEKISAIAVVQAFGQSLREGQRIAKQGEQLKEAMILQARASAQLRSIGDATASLSTAVILLVGSHEVSAGHATAGTVVAAMSIVGLITPLLRDLSSAFVLWHGANVSNGKIREFLETSSLIAESPDAPDLEAPFGKLEFRNVRLGTTLNGISVTAEAGARIAVIGPNGSGKSTLLSLAARLVDPDGGEVLLDGQLLKGHSLASLRRCLGMVSPDLPLLRGSIEKNLRYRWPEAPEEELTRILALCGVEEILTELPDGLKSKLSDGGSNLSLGQRQRVSLARALLGSPRVLLLDEADANLDPKAGRVLERVLATYRGTTLLISHHYDQVCSADYVWYMENGRVLETGSPSDVFSRSGPASRFFKSTKTHAVSQ